jgi:hypothetical protein
MTNGPPLVVKRAGVRKRAAIGGNSRVIAQKGLRVDDGNISPRERPQYLTESKDAKGNKVIKVTEDGKYSSRRAALCWT